MAADNKQFSASVSAWVRKSDARMLAVFKEATQRTVSIAQGLIPIDTGFARASVRASLQSMPPIDPNFKNEKGVAVPYNQGAVTLVIANAQLGQTIYVGWTANYVGHLERGHSSQAPSGFVGLAALQWKRTVSQVVEEARARVASSAGTR